MIEPLIAADMPEASEEIPLLVRGLSVEAMNNITAVYIAMGTIKGGRKILGTIYLREMSLDMILLISCADKEICKFG